ncbi:hypothetical protein A2J03_22630 [Rhodococcus sp. EPR-157]|uniref:hypothetical protein n=1 Tax=Rhodococcus sp. EPR-157 TaxID=1813677 RepID=UPI0007BC518F|nr:hypothetical protein [Rhodococcus sp. EPR-157]KZF07806.1 hypothetical protein A2J03_22630 [Rhodococcus sp. EPR-157]
MTTPGRDLEHPAPEQLLEARGWLLDCGFSDELIDDLTDRQIVPFLDRIYDGGWDAFLVDSTGYVVERESSPTTGTANAIAVADALAQWTVMLAKAHALGQLQPDDQTAPASNGADL